MSVLPISPLQSPQTVAALLRMGTEQLRDAGSDSPRLDAELLLGKVLGTDRASLLAESAAQLTASQLASYAGLLERRAAGEPVAYIRGRKEFFGREFLVDRRALIPRPETERLVELALCRLDERLATGVASRTFMWEVGVGSGAVAVTLAAERSGAEGRWRLLATDSSADALALARSNAERHRVAQLIEFAQADLLDWPIDERPDLLVANLPYVPTAVIPRLSVASSFEPRLALDGGSDGLVVIRRLLGQLGGVLAAGGQALLEIGADQAEPLRATMAEALPGWQLDVHADLAGQPRVAELWR
jgi:release factor glutamine methyltransferase